MLISQCLSLFEIQRRDLEATTDTTLKVSPRRYDYSLFWIDYDPVESGRNDYARLRQMSYDRIRNNIQRDEKVISAGPHC